MRLHRRPLGGDDAEDYSVAQCAVRRNLVVAQNAVLLSAQPFDGAPALVIEEMRAELYCNAVDGLESMPQQQQFALGVERCALHPLGIPSRADLDPAVSRVDVHVGGHARDLASGIEYRERQHRSGLLQTQPAVDLLGHVLRPRHRGVPELEQLTVLDGIDEPLEVVMRQRLEPCMLAAKGNGIGPGHWCLLIASLRSATKQSSYDQSRMIRKNQFGKFQTPDCTPARDAPHA